MTGCERRREDAGFDWTAGACAGGAVVDCSSAAATQRPAGVTRGEKYKNKKSYKDGGGAGVGRAHRGDTADDGAGNTKRVNQY